MEDVRKDFLTVGFSAVIGILCLVLLSVLWSAAWNGYTLSVLWAWFIAPKFGLPELGIAQAYGLCLVAAAMTCRRPPDKAKDRDDFADLIIRSIAWPPFVSALLLCVGAVTRLWL